jgi:uncharacterized protein involved in exopolysaccharide biosynthesis
MTTAVQPGISPRDLVEAVFRRKMIVLITLPLVVLGAIVITAITAKRYDSEMKILVQNSRGNIVISAQQTTGSVVTEVTEQEINSELEILHSRDVLDAVVDPQWNAKPISERPAEEIRAHNKLVSDLESRLTADSGRKSNIITVSYQGTSPKESQQTLNRLQEAFLAEERVVKRPSGTSEFFAKEAESYGAQWEQATKDFVDFQQENHLVSLPDREDAVEKDISTQQGTIRLMDVGRRELSGRIDESERRLRDTPERQVTEDKTLPNQQAVQQLNTLVVELENKRTTLLNQYQPTDRLVVEINQQIDQTKEALVSAAISSAHEKTTDVNPSWQQVLTRSIQDRISRNALEEQRETAKRQLDTLQGELTRLQGLSVQYNELKSKVDDLKANYLLYTQKRDQTQIEDKMDAQQFQNVSIAEHPTFSYIPVSPKPLRTLALAIVTGLFLSFALIYLAELGRTTVVTPRELERASKFPVLTSVPVFPESIVAPRKHHTTITTVEQLNRMLNTFPYAGGKP